MEEAEVNKKTRGRQRIEIKKLQNKETLEVTFSKRKKGLFNKASELSVLCGAEVAIIIISPNNRPFTYGHPSVEAVLDRVLTEKEDDSGWSSSSLTNHNEIDVIKEEFKELLEQLEEEEKIAEEIKLVNEANENASRFWWDEYCSDDMGLEELEHCSKCLEQMKIKVVDELAAREGQKTDMASAFNQLIDSNHIFNDIPPLDFAIDDGYVNDMIMNRNIEEGFDYV